MGLPIARCWHLLALSAVLGSSVSAPVLEPASLAAEASKVAFLAAGAELDQTKNILSPSFTEDEINDSEPNGISSPFDEKELANENLTSDGPREPATETPQLVQTEVAIPVVSSATSSSTDEQAVVSTSPVPSTTAHVEHTTPLQTTTMMSTMAESSTSPPVPSVGTNEVPLVTTEPPALSSTSTPVSAEVADLAASLTMSTADQEVTSYTSASVSTTTSIAATTTESVSPTAISESGVASEVDLTSSTDGARSTVVTDSRNPEQHPSATVASTITASMNVLPAPAGAIFRAALSNRTVTSTSDSALDAVPVARPSSVSTPPSSLETQSATSTTDVPCPCATQRPQVNVGKVVETELTTPLINDTKMPSTTEAASVTSTTTTAIITTTTTTATTIPEGNILLEREPSFESRSVHALRKNSQISASPMVTPVNDANTEKHPVSATSEDSTEAATPLQSPAAAAASTTTSTTTKPLVTAASPSDVSSIAIVTTTAKPARGPTEQSALVQQPTRSVLAQVTEEADTSVVSTGRSIQPETPVVPDTPAEDTDNVNSPVSGVAINENQTDPEMKLASTDRPSTAPGPVEKVKHNSESDEDDDDDSDESAEQSEGNEEDLVDPNANHTENHQRQADRQQNSGEEDTDEEESSSLIPNQLAGSSGTNSTV